jgi:hypothetical protein
MLCLATASVSGGVFEDPQSTTVLDPRPPPRWATLKACAGLAVTFVRAWVRR